MLPLTYQNNVTSQWGTGKLQVGFYFCTVEVIFSSSVQVTPNSRKVGKTVTKDHITPLSKEQRQNKGKENAFSLVICLGSWKLVLIMPNVSWSAILEPVETGHCWNNEDVIMWDNAAVHTAKTDLICEKDPFFLMQTGDHSSETLNAAKPALAPLSVTPWALLLPLHAAWQVCWTCFAEQWRKGESQHLFYRGQSWGSQAWLPALLTSIEQGIPLEVGQCKDLILIHRGLVFCVLLGNSPTLGS